MADSGSGAGDIFDVKKLRRLIELMNEADLSEIDLRNADQRIRLRKGHDPIITTGALAAAPVAAAAAPSGATGSAAAAPAPAKVDDANVLVIKSPFVGTFYGSPNPDSPPFVKVGDVIGPEKTVCIVEAMKVFNEVPAECSGKVVAVLAKSGDPVEYGQVLFKVEASA